MSEIRRTDGICTQINVVKLPADNQEEVLKLMIERARFMATQPGFVFGQPAPQQGRQSCRQLRAVDESRQTQGCAPRAGVPQEMAALQ